MQRLLIGVKYTQDDDGAVFFDSKMDGIGEGIDGFDADIVVADGGGSRQLADLSKVGIEGVLKAIRLQFQRGQSQVIVTCLMINKIEKKLGQLPGIQVEKHGRVLALILKWRVRGTYPIPPENHP